MGSHFFACLGLVVSVTAALAGCSPHPTGDAGPSAITPRPATVTVLSSEPLAGVEGREVRMLTVEYPPGGLTPAHRHPGAVFVYVLEGEVISGLDGGTPVRYRAGQLWSERPGQVHSTARNASDAKPAKLLVFFVTEPGKPVLEMEH